jgi:RNA polymerase sigma factor (sigma-70 family)
LNGKNKYTEQELLEGLISQRNDVLQSIYSLYFKTVRRLIFLNNGREEDAKDIFQETLVIIYRKLQKDKTTLNCSLKTYIYSVARLLWLKELENKRNRNINLEECDQFVDIEDNDYELVGVNERLKLYHEQFEQLSNDCKKILKLFLNNISIAEITKIMGYSSVQHTKNRRYRCKKSLIERIRNNPKYEELKNGNNDDNREIPRW